MFLEKFGQPTAKGTYPTNAQPLERQRLLQALQAISTDSAVIIVDRKTGEIHVLPRGVDPGWDYAPGASRTDLARRAVERKIEAAPSDIAAAARADRGLAKVVTGEGETPQPKVPLAGLDTEYAEGVRQLLTRFQLLNTGGYLPRGVTTVTVEDAAYLAATDSVGGFKLSRRPDPALGGASGQEPMTGALTDLREGRPLTFEREYAVETLWHEVLHNNQAVPLPEKLPRHLSRLVEGLHQAIARQTYPEFLRSLGREPAFLRQIRERGLSGEDGPHARPASAPGPDGRGLSNGRGRP